jgi:hypothetical protein
MRLAPLLIIEGRKEDLRKKYTEKFKEYPETLDMVLGLPDLKNQNFKYGDFVLDNLHPNSALDEIGYMMELIKDFDRFKPSFEKKDINQYSWYELMSTIENHKQKSKSYNKKANTEGAKKLYEDSNILIVKPLTYEASCKYGSGTRWCTTMANQPSYFKQYTSGDDQALYYVILKKFDRSNKFYKIAIHKKPGAETWYDATDERMTEREKEVFNLGAPKVIETIRNDWDKEQEKYQQHIFDKIFDWENYSFFDISKELRTKEKVGLEFYQAERTNYKEQLGQATLNISIDEDNIDSYYLEISYGIHPSNQNNLVFFDVSFSPKGAWPEDSGIDLPDGYRQILFNYDWFTDRRNFPEKVFNKFCEEIKKWVVYSLRNSPEFMSKIHGGKTVWSPNRSSYGYTFKRQDSGLIKQLVDFLDSGKEGTKLDFLADVGILQKKEENGKPYFARVGQNDWRQPSVWRGQHSGFFNSAKLSGILDYDKKGHQFYLKKGPNFDKFKEGELKAL